MCCWLRDNPAQFRLCIPDCPSLRQHVLLANHANIRGEHRSRDSTYVETSLRAFWPGLLSDVETFVSECSTCQRAQVPVPVPAPQAQISAPADRPPASSTSPPVPSHEEPEASESNLSDFDTVISESIACQHAPVSRPTPVTDARASRPSWRMLVSSYMLAQYPPSRSQCWYPRICLPSTPSYEESLASENDAELIADMTTARRNSLNTSRRSHRRHQGGPMPTSNDSEAGPSRPQDMSTPAPAQTPVPVPTQSSDAAKVRPLRHQGSVDDGGLRCESPTNIDDIATPSAFTLWRQSLEAWVTLEAASELEAPEAPMQPDQGALHSRPANLVEYALSSDSGPDSDSGSDNPIRRRHAGTFGLWDHDQALQQGYFLRRQEISEIVRGDNSDPEYDQTPHSTVFQQTVGTGYHPQ